MKQPTLGNPQNTIAVLQKYNFTFQKKFGQNFLIDPHVLDKIIRAAEIGPEGLCTGDRPGDWYYDSVSGMCRGTCDCGGD